MSKETLNPFEIAQKQVKAACDKLNADPAVYEILKNPMRVMEVSFPVKMDDGRIFLMNQRFFLIFWPRMSQFKRS